MATPDNALPVRTLAQEHPWAPLREPLFRGLWIASVISFTGTWVQNVGSGWFMASLTPSAMMVALVQAASSLPVFLVAIPAGALADMLDRRRLLIFAQTWMMLVAFALATLAGLHLVGPALLLALTFLLGLGAVINDPAWQAIAPDVVSAPRLASGIALNSVGFNIARAIGPPLGGLVIALAGPPAAFALNGLSFLGVILFLRGWRPERTAPAIPLSRLLHCIGEGWRHLSTSPQVKAVLVRTGLFTLFASALWALLPLKAQPFGPIGYGLMLASFGFGAFLSSWILPGLRVRLGSTNALIAFASVTFALALFIFLRRICRPAECAPARYLFICLFCREAWPGAVRSGARSHQREDCAWPFLPPLSGSSWVAPPWSASASIPTHLSPLRWASVPALISRVSLLRVILSKAENPQTTNAGKHACTFSTALPT